MNKYFKFNLTLFLFTGFLIVLAQDKPDIKFKVGGTVQAMASFSETAKDTNLVGFGLRRVRLKVTGSFGDKIQAYIQTEFTNPSLTDALIDYFIQDNMKLRIGRYKVAGVLGGGLTSHHKIDIVERARIGQEWGARTVGSSFRDFGVSAIGNLGDFNYFVSIFNGSGGDVNIKSSQKGKSSIVNNGVSVSGLFEFKPQNVRGLNIGGYVGQGNKVYNDYISYSGHVYWEPRPIRIKAEYVSIIDKNTSTDITTNGFYLMGAYGINKSVELLARFEMFDPITNIDDNEETLVTLGATYFVFPGDWTSGKITAAYVFRNDKLGTNGNDLANNVFYIMFQAAF